MHEVLLNNVDICEQGPNLTFPTFGAIQAYLSLGSSLVPFLGSSTKKIEKMLLNSL